MQLVATTGICGVGRTSHSATHDPDSWLLWHPSAALLRGSAHNYHSRRPTPSSRLLPHVETLMLVKLSCLQLPGERCLIVANGTTTMTFSLQMTDSALSV